MKSMKVKDVLRDLGPKTLVQIYKPSSVSSGYVESFLKAYPAGETNYLDYSWVKSDLEKEVDHVEYGHYYTTNEMVASCNIYLNREVGSTNENELTVFFKKLDPDAYVNLRIWYGDPKDDAGEFFLIGLSGADYRPASYSFNYFHDLFECLEISKISYRADQDIFLDCVKKEKK